jgi:hypothetical protein
VIGWAKLVRSASPDLACQCVTRLGTERHGVARKATLSAELARVHLQPRNPLDAVLLRVEDDQVTVGLLQHIHGGRRTTMEVIFSAGSHIFGPIEPTSTYAKDQQSLSRSANR